MIEDMLEEVLNQTIKQALIYCGSHIKARPRWKALAVGNSTVIDRQYLVAKC